MAININQKSELCVKKIPTPNTQKPSKYINQESENYSRCHSPFLPKFYGNIKDKNYVVIEYINGQTLRNFQSLNLSFDGKITIIFELILALAELHSHQIIHRDLKPDNVIIDNYKKAILIDLESARSNINDEEHTMDIGGDQFVDPEVKRTKMFTYKSDIYSLGMIMKHIMNEKEIEENQKIKCIIGKCIDQESKKRPSIIDLFNEFWLELTEKNKLVIIFYMLEKIYLNHDNISNICNYISNLPSSSVFLNDKEAQFILGFVYHEGRYITRNIDKAIHYYSLAANQKFPKSQINLSFLLW